MESDVNSIDDLNYMEKVFNDLKFDQYLISYIDLLGTKSAIIKDETAFLLSVYQLFETAKELCERFGDKLQFVNIKMKAFSDNIVFLYRISLEQSHAEKCRAIQCLSSFTCMFQFLALNKKILMRGGMTFGSLCFNETLIWGKALIDAYQMENLYAIYPRILVSTQIIEFMIDPNAENQSSIPILLDADGQYYLNFLSTFHDGSQAFIISHILSIVSDLEKKHVGEIKVLQKLSWLKSYILRFQNENEITEQMIIEALDEEKRIHEDIMSEKHEKS